MEKALILCLAFFAGPACAGLSSAEQDYIKYRDADIAQMAQFAKSTDTKAVDEKNNSYLKELGTRLNSIIVTRTGEHGEINLETLIDEGGFNMADGLRYGAPNRVIFATTKDLFDAYLAANKLKADFFNPQAGEHLCSLIFDWDSAFYTYAAVPLEKIPAGWEARAWLATDTQDPGPEAPQDIIILARTKGGMVLAAHLGGVKGTRQFSACKTQWQQQEAKNEEIKNNDERMKAYDSNFNAYRKCYMENFSKKPNAFHPLQNQAAKVMDKMAELFD
jgi:hypothetical protein